MTGATDNPGRRRVPGAADLPRAAPAAPEIGIDEVVLHDADPQRLAVISAVLAGEPGPRATVRLDGR